MRRCTALIGAIALFLGVLAAPARADVAIYEFANGARGAPATLTLTADATASRFAVATFGNKARVLAPGEVFLPIARVWHEVGIVPDLNGPTNCVTAPGALRCSELRPFYPIAVTLDLGNGDDHAKAEGASRVQFFAGGGNDTLIGSELGDQFYWSPGRDDMSGRGGVDSMSFMSPTGNPVLPPGAGVTVTLDDVADDGLAAEADNVRSDVEEVAGGFGPDVLVGSAGANHLNGNPGDDRIEGGGGDDNLWGGFIGPDPGNDRIDGGPGADRLLGGGDDDELDGGSGDDELRGDSGADLMVGGTGSDELSASEAGDRVEARDGEVDEISCFGAGVNALVIADAVDQIRGCGNVQIG